MKDLRRRADEAEHPDEFSSGAQVQDSDGNKTDPDNIMAEGGAHSSRWA